MAERLIMDEGAVLSAAEDYRLAIEEAKEADALLAEFREKLLDAEAVQEKAWGRVGECKRALVEAVLVDGVVYG